MQYILFITYENHKLFNDFEELKKALYLLDKWAFILRYNPDTEGWSQATIIAGQKSYSWKGIALHPDYPSRSVGTAGWSPMQQHPENQLDNQRNRWLCVINEEPYLSPKQPSWCDFSWRLEALLTT